MNEQQCLTELKELPMGNRITNQRMVILKYLRCVMSHPTAEQIYLAVKRKLPHISLGTVYRNLDFLSRQNFLLELQGNDDKTHYDGHMDQHDHFVCENCRKIYDIDEIRRSGKNPKLKIGTVKSVHLNYYGICRSCQNKK